jgi:hypothetical protein
MTRTLGRGLGAAALVGALATVPAGATTLRRAGLHELTEASGTIVVGDVVGSRSYWNDDRTFILTDVRVAPREVLKGVVEGTELTVTLLGGSVAEVTTIIVGGAELVPGKGYVLFLGEEDLPGRAGARTVRDLCQGAFDLRQDGKGAWRAVSQANAHALLPDALGQAAVPGGSEGLALPEMLDSIRDAVKREADAQERNR